MGHFSQCICLALIHSLWQSATLLGLHALVSKNKPGKRSSFAFVYMQLIFLVATFWLYFNQNLQIPSIDYSGITVDGDIYPALFFLYITIVTLRFTRLYISWRKFRGTHLKSVQKVPAEVRSFVSMMCYRIGIRQTIHVFYSNYVTAPLTFGFFKPVILLPVALVANLSIKQTESLILHELTHIKYNDYLRNHVLVCVEVIFFFNPFVLQFCRIFRLERELRCDDHVLQFQYPAVEYAETLLKAALFAKRNHALSLAATGSNGQLLQRVEYLTGFGHKRKKTPFAALLPLPLIVLLSATFGNLNSGSSSVKQASAPALLVNATASTPVMAATSAAEPASSALKVFTGKKKNQKNTPTKKSGKHSPAVYPAIEQNVYALPVVLTEVQDIKDITVTEENEAAGITVTKVFEVKVVKGAWVKRLKWSITEYKHANAAVIDSMVQAVGMIAQ